VYQRLRQKDQEWRKQKSELLAKWKAGCETNYEGSMDFQCYFKRREAESGFSAEQFREECQHARSYCSSPEKQSGSVASFGLSCLDRSAVLYEPYAVVEMKPDSPVHHTAVRLLLQQVVLKLNDSDKGKQEREMVGRIWTEFMLPFFGYPVHWVQDEARESFCGKLNNIVVQCKFPIIANEINNMIQHSKLTNQIVSVLIRCRWTASENSFWRWYYSCL